MVAEMIEEKIDKLAKQCLAKHPEMDAEDARRWAKKKAHDWIVVLRMTNSTVSAVVTIINGEATVVLNNDPASRRVFFWDKIEDKFLKMFPDYTLEIEE